MDLVAMSADFHVHFTFFSGRDWLL